MQIEDRLSSLCTDKDKNKKKIRKISAICADSREIVLDSVFVAIKGRKTDGHYYLQSAVKKGAQILVVEHTEGFDTNLFHGMVCVVPDTRAVLPVLLNDFYNFPSEKMFCVGITGTNGKTTVSNILSFLFSRCGWRTGLIGTIKNSFKDYEEKSTLTTPDPVKLYDLLNRFFQKGAQAMVMEVSSIGLDQKRVTGLDFNIGVFTNLSEDHLDYHLNMSNYFQAKKELFKMSTYSSGSVNKNHFMAVLNLDDPYCVKLVREIKSPYISYGKEQARFSWEIISGDLSGTWFNLYFDKKKLKVYLPIPGIYNVSNATAALCCVYVAGFSVEEAVEALKDFPGVLGRMERVCPDKHPLVFVDYAHTPKALESALSCLRDCHDAPESVSRTDKRDIESNLITVFGCGGERDKEKRPLMARIAETFSDQVILTSDNPRTEDLMNIINDCMKGVEDKNKFIIEPDRRKAIYQALEIAKKEDIVLIAGKGHEREQIVGASRQSFSDTEIVKEYFSDPNKP